ncbi:NAD(P)H-dependent flavin oxidoreductase [Alteriqipengyuania lutimaris]|uniref:Nitronate monooxygenase n=1 Tax=Alteriqipengyuania lutimaris TaxID=1538146 RepID=A0A395LK10_9SPHN|nr:nitronate monooxygenase [Alteriqipengyuania lutimaris]MBB3033701.1 nitronate monooxygenase [Alteriqipengyuania lutimaris]RDS77313.1 nitronate monooxygenase [Alteriqipengyuania lutimaris]
MSKEILNRLRLPVVAAPMFLVSGPDMVIAAARAGIVGAFPTPNCRTTEQVDEWMTRIVAETADAPGLWAANLVTHSSNPRLADDLAMVAKHKPPIVITALGSPVPAIEVVHSYGGLVLADVVNEKLGRKAAAAGADGLVAVASGAGGHTGSLSPFAFVSVLREFFDGIVCVGGAIADGAGVAGAVAAGADLVYVGTRFLAAEESMAEPDYKQMVVDSRAEDLVVSPAITGTAASWLKPSLVKAGYDLDALDKPATRDYGGDPAKKWRDLWAAGQGLHTITDTEPLADIVDTLENGWSAARDRLHNFGREK